ncbi:MAG: phosphotransferase [Oleibacter sp.]|nr:phosphotransferase [Thalassolituus sp.]
MLEPSKLPAELHSVFDDWMLWPCSSTSSAKPKWLGKVEGGLNNDNHLIEFDGQHWLLRLHGTHNDHTSQDLESRQTEYQVHQAMAALGIAPTISYRSVNKHYWLRPFLNGAAINAEDIDNEMLKRMLVILNRVHQQNLNDLFVSTKTLKTLDTHAALNNYVESAHQRQKIGLHQRALLAHVIEVLPRLPACEAVLCHIDPTLPNWILGENNALQLIDWEYCAIAHPLIDLAMLFHSLPTTLHDQFSEDIKIVDQPSWPIALRHSDLLTRIWLLAFQAPTFEDLFPEFGELLPS